MIDLNNVTYPSAHQVRYDLDAIVARLRATAETWVPRLFPNGRRVGDEWRLANIKGAPPRKQGSCVIALKGEHAGDWHDFDGNQGGGPLSTLEQGTGHTGRDLFTHAADLAGWSPGAPIRQAPPPTARPERDTAREIAFVLDHTRPIAKTPAAAYLRGRGLVVPDNADLLAHLDLTHWDTKSGYPAMIGVVRDRADNIVAIHRTYLQSDPDQPDNVAKAPVAKPRMMLGKTGGGTVRLAPLGQSCVLALSEGIETGLAVMTACPGLAVWATLSTSGLEQVQLPPDARRIIILADHDASGAGLRAAETLARRLRVEDREVAIALPPKAGLDFNDLLLRGGPEAVRAVFGRNGKLLTTPGYHPDARLLYSPAAGFEVPAIAQRPSAEQVAAARSLICDDLLGDFPFVSPSEHAHAVALLLLGVLRSMIDGPTPLHLIEKPTPGTGATLMVDAIATILTGAGASVMTEGRDDEEWRKRVTAKLRQVPSIVLIDNLRQKLDSAAVAAALTAPFWEDRILGASEMARLPIRCVWIATGNNPEFSNEMARRLVRIRLDAHVERPWQRAGFRHPDLMTWVRANRARLVAACLTICQAWLAAGRPRGARTIGSYENWAQVLGGVLEVAGIEGFLGNLDEMLEASDGEGAVWRSFVSAWWDRFGTAEVGTSDLYELALTAEPPLPLGSGNDRGQRTRLGKALSRMRDRIFRVGQIALQIDSRGTYQGAQRLAIDEKTGTDERSRRSPESPGLVNVVNVGERADANDSSPYVNDLEDTRERRERREPFPNAYACARACVRAIEDPEKRSRRSPHSPGPEKSIAYGREHGGERSQEGSPISNPPDWLKEVL